MNTLTARHPFTVEPSRPGLGRTPSAAKAATRNPSPQGWIERLADWSDRQPVHHRVGSWVLYR